VAGAASIVSLREELALLRAEIRALRPAGDGR
jgi:hypothetical protein